MYLWIEKYSERGRWHLSSVPPLDLSTGLWNAASGAFYISTRITHGLL